MQRIGISISECEDMRELGMGIMHLQDAFVESARNLLMKGYSLAYGGDLTYDGSYNFAEILFQLAMTYGSKKEVRVFNYSAFPLYTKITTEKEAELKNTAQIIKVDPENGNDGLGIRYKNATVEQKKALDKIFANQDDASREIWANSLTAMRKKMTKEIQGRIVAGGKMNGFKGRYPGVLEETVMALKEEISIAIDGRYGGSSKAMLEELKGESTALSDRFGEYVRPLLESKPVWLNDHVAVLKGNTPVDFIRAVFTSDMISTEKKDVIDFWQHMNDSENQEAPTTGESMGRRLAQDCMASMATMDRVEIGSDTDAIAFKVEELYNSINNPLNKLIVVGNGSIRFLIPKEMLADFLLRNRHRPGLTLADFLNDSHEAIRKMKSNGVVTVSKAASIEDVARLINSDGNCHEVFVTETGGNHEPVLGWISEHALIRFLNQ